MLISTLVYRWSLVISTMGCSLEPGENFSFRGREFLTALKDRPGLASGPMYGV